MFIAVAGISHHHTPLDLRERLSFSGGAIIDLLPELRRCPDIEECCILSTCNRTEFYLTAPSRNQCQDVLLEFMEKKTALPVGELRRHMYFYTLQEAVRHLFRVAAGLDSMALGETQIAAQVKKAYELARLSEATGPVLNTLFQAALAAGKRVRAETGIDQWPVSIPYIAAELLKRALGSLAGRSVLLVGAGKMSATAMTHLQENGVTGIVVANRSPLRAGELAEKYGGRAVSYAELPACLAEADIVITGAAAARGLITAEMTEQALTARAGRPLFLIDMAAPRNIEPAVREIPGATLLDLDDFHCVEDAGWAQRRVAAEQGEKIVVRECENFMARLAGHSVTPTIRALNERFRAVQAAELEAALQRLGPHDPRQAEALTQLAAALVGKLLHQPICALRSFALQPEGHAYAKMTEALFGLNKESEADETEHPGREPGKPAGPAPDGVGAAAVASRASASVL
ncbi:MAG: glutamyl-tRNA reductase [Gracilibacteraceae bacterium]|jgi:glutamyl-tRNA reductase|nr:glutamyl-tRNA reductase [Gracilibacteraceae bacterium]